MIDEPDFSIEGEDSAAAAEPKATPPPRVVIEYRERGVSSLLVPPLLILIVALAILVFRRETPILVPPPAPARTTAEAGLKGSASPEAGNADTTPVPVESPATIPTFLVSAPAATELPDLDELLPPLAASAASAPAPAERPGLEKHDATAASEAKPTEVTSGPTAPPAEENRPADNANAKAPDADADAPPTEVARVAEPERPRKPVPIGRPLDPPPIEAVEPPAPAPVAAAPAQPPEEVTKEQVLAEIRDEAARRAAEIRKIEDLKPQVKFLEVGRVIKKAEANRAPFHKGLKEILKSRRPNKGQDIEALCNEYGRTTLPEIRTHIHKIITTTYARSTLKVKIEMMRAWGYPESMIFDYVANDVDRHLGTPGGPRDGDEVRVRAAKLLVSMPPAGRSLAGSAPTSSSHTKPRPQ